LDRAAVCVRVVPGDFGHKGTATSAGLVSVGLRVGVGIVIGGVQEESMGLVDARVM
jgi:hypothetical protein